MFTPNKKRTLFCGTKKFAKWGSFVKQREYNFNWFEYFTCDMSKTYLILLYFMHPARRGGGVRVAVRVFWIFSSAENNCDFSQMIQKIWLLMSYL